MDVFSIDLTVNEMHLIRQALEIITITGKDAKFVVNLQLKLEQELAQIQEMLKQAESAKQKELQTVIESEEKKPKK
jgi:hypothetical protein